MTEEDRRELRKISAWLCLRSSELLRQCSARHQAAESMQTASAHDLKAAAQLAGRLSGRKVKRMTVKEARNSANFDSKIAQRLETEAASLSTWAQMLERLSAPEKIDA